MNPPEDKRQLAVFSGVSKRSQQIISTISKAYNPLRYLMSKLNEFIKITQQEEAIQAIKKEIRKTTVKILRSKRSWRSFYSVMVNMLGCEILVGEFELKSC